MPKGTPNTEPFCSFPNCGKPNRSKGLCGGHYAQLLKGKPLTPLVKPPPDPTLPRECLTCHEVKPISEFYMRSDGLPDRHCKRCAGDAMKPGAAKRRREAGMKERRLRVVTTINGTEGQECSWCREWKPLTDYYAFTSKRDDYAGHLAECKECTKGRRKVAARQREGFRPNMPAMGEDPLIVAARQVRFQQAGKGAEAYRKGRAKDPERYRNYSQQRRALVANAPVNDLTGEQIAELMTAQAGICAYCHHFATPLVVEHIVPLARGGSHTLSNVVGACDRCNGEKHNRTPEEWAAARRRKAIRMGMDPDALFHIYDPRDMQGQSQEAPSLQTPGEDYEPPQAASVVGAEVHPLGHTVKLRPSASTP